LQASNVTGSAVYSNYVSGSLRVTTQPTNTSTNSAGAFVINFVNNPDAEGTNVSGWRNVNKPSFSGQTTVNYCIRVSVPNNGLVNWTVTKRTLYLTSTQTFRSPPQLWCNGFTVVGAQAPNGSDILYIPAPNNSAGYMMGISTTYGGPPSSLPLTTTPQKDQGIFFTQYYCYLDGNGNTKLVLSNIIGKNCVIGTNAGNITVNQDGTYNSTNWDYVMIAGGPTTYNLS
jgi:hypothetical protein